VPAKVSNPDDVFTLQINGYKYTHFTRFSFTRGIIRQPSTFSFTIGSGELARKLMLEAQSRDAVQLFVGTTKIFTGIIEDVNANNSSGGTEVTLEGRDRMAPLTKEYVLDEKAFGSPTYFDLTKQVLDIVGYQNTTLVAGNDANRKAAARVAAKLKGGQKSVAIIPTNLTTSTGAKIEYQKIDCEIGQTWFDFLVSQYKRVGLYLWCGADGNLVLARPTSYMFPSYSVQRYRGISRDECNIIKSSFTNRTSGRHARCRVYGKGRPDKDGHIALYGNWEDYEMLRMGYTETRVEHDEDCKTQRDCQYKAKRLIAEERRANRTLKYTVQGYTVPVFGEEWHRAIWTPDTVVRVDDDEYSFTHLTDARDDNALANDQGIHENMYLESVEFTLDGSGATTTLSLMRESDMMFLGDETEVMGDSEIKRETVTTIADPI
jgi:prophage tail gpP-like protein